MRNNVDFACKVIENQSSPGGGKTLNAVAKYGVSVDSPFKNKFTTNHPSTRQLLDYNDKARPTQTAASASRIASLSLGKQIREYSKMKGSHPKMFTNILRHGAMSKEKQREHDNFYNRRLREQVKLQFGDLEKMKKLDLSRSVANKTPFEENEKYKREVENLSYRRQPLDEDGFARADSDTSSEDNGPAVRTVGNEIVDIGALPKTDEVDSAPAKVATHTSTAARTPLRHSDAKLDSTLRKTKDRM